MLSLLAKNREQSKLLVLNLILHVHSVLEHDLYYYKQRKYENNKLLPQLIHIRDIFHKYLNILTSDADTCGDTFDGQAIVG